MEVLNLFDIKPIRPLILAVAERFNEKETEKATKFCVSFGVRLMIASRTRTGSVEEGIARRLTRFLSRTSRQQRISEKG